MDFLTLAKNRFSVRKFDSTPVEREKIDKIIMAGHIAPTACNIQPQRILVLESDSSLSALKECTRCHFDAPLAMLVCYDKDECWTRKYDGSLSGEIDASIVTTHMMLEASSLGIGSTWVMHFNPAKVVEAFNIPKNLVPTAILVMGYPAPDAVPLDLHDKKRPLDEIVHYNEF